MPGERANTKPPPFWDGSAIEKGQRLRQASGIQSLLLVGGLLLLMSGCAHAEFQPGASPTAGLSITQTLSTPIPLPTLHPAPTATPNPTKTPLPTQAPTPKPAVLIGAGDISYCGKDYLGDDQTARLMLGLLKEFPEAQVFTAGDNVQGDGLAWEYRDCFNPTWGQFKDRIHPAPGNHDYQTEQGGPYYAYFGAAAGQAGLGYYSYDLGDWHVVALNSNCNDIACGANSAQAQWLRADLTCSAKRCTLLYWHNPRWSSGLAGGSGAVGAFWNIASEFGAEVVVNGHDHDYERFAPQDAAGKAAPNGVREFVAGTGGAPERQWGHLQPNSEARDASTWGVLKFSLYPGRYEWEFIPVAGGTFHDSGSGECH